jgi:hypothetical protein
MLTERDNEIIKHLEIYKYATIEQLEKIFFKNQQYSYNICRRRLSKIRELGYIKCFRDISTNKFIYMINEEKIKPPALHRIILLDVYAELIYLGFEVEVFDIERPWMDGKIRSDGFTVFKMDNDDPSKRRKYVFFIEVHTSHNPNNLFKYDVLYKSNEVQQYLGKADYFPRVMLISDRNYKDIQLEHTKIVTLNTKLDSFASVLV